MGKHYKRCMHAKVYQVNEYIITTSILLQLLYNDTIQKLTLIILSLMVGNDMYSQIFLYRKYQLIYLEVLNYQHEWFIWGLLHFHLG